MKPLARLTVILLLASVLGGGAARASENLPPAAAPAGMTFIPAGDYAPLLRMKDEPERSAVAAYWLDTRPVTNAEFLEFVRAHPQ